MTTFIIFSGEQTISCIDKFQYNISFQMWNCCETKSAGTNDKYLVDKVRKKITM